MQKNKQEAERVKSLEKRRESRQDKYEEVIYKRLGDVKLPDKTFSQKLTYDFLQYIRIVFKWACETYDISRPNLELLLYIYPIGLFKKTDVEIFCKTIDMRPVRVFNKLITEGWVVLWRPRSKGRVALYTLSTKGKILCGKMHKICTGESEIPESKYNPVVNSEKVVDKYYLEIIKRMNKRDLNDKKDVNDKGSD